MRDQRSSRASAGRGEGVVEAMPKSTGTVPEGEVKIERIVGDAARLMGGRAGEAVGERVTVNEVLLDVRVG